MDKLFLLAMGARNLFVPDCCSVHPRILPRGPGHSVPSLAMVSKANVLLPACDARIFRGFVSLPPTLGL